MKHLLLAAFCSLFCTHLAVAAETSTCEAKASEKNLKGAAKTSFMKKCEKDAAAATSNSECTAKADEKKLKGAARTSFVKKCTKDAATPAAAAPVPAGK